VQPQYYLWSWLDDASNDAADAESTNAEPDAESTDAESTDAEYADAKSTHNAAADTATVQKAQCPGRSEGLCLTDHY